MLSLLNNKKTKTGNHHIIIRHFKTKNDKINYSKCYDESKPYIKFIKSYIEKNNIKEIEFQIGRAHV